MVIQLHFSFTGILINKKCRWSNMNKATTFIFIFSYYMIISPCHHIEDNWLPMTDLTFLVKWSLCPQIIFLGVFFVLESILLIFFNAKEINFNAEILYSLFQSEIRIFFFVNVNCRFWESEKTGPVCVVLSCPPIESESREVWAWHQWFCYVSLQALM